MSRIRYFELYVSCPRCRTQIEAEIRVTDGRIDVLRHELCPNELGVDGHRTNSTRGLHPAARNALAAAGLI